MKYDVLLSDYEIEEILNLNLSFVDRIEWFQNRYTLEEIKNNRKVKFIYLLIQGTGISGKIENNPKGLCCPNCKGKYVVKTFVGDFYYRLFNGTKKQKKQGKKMISQMGLHYTPWTTADYHTRDYLCLNCAVRWNKVNEDIYRDIEELNR